MWFGLDYFVRPYLKRTWLDSSGRRYIVALLGDAGAVKSWAIGTPLPCNGGTIEMRLLDSVGDYWSVGGLANDELQRLELGHCCSAFASHFCAKLSSLIWRTELKLGAAAKMACEKCIAWEEWRIIWQLSWARVACYAGALSAHKTKRTLQFRCISGGQRR